MCCKKIKDLLHPFNIFGKKIVHRMITLPPIIIPNANRVSIVWEGERLEASYTIQYWADGRVQGTPYFVTVTDGEPKEIWVQRDMRHSLLDDTVYFKCTNVTSLVVNGEQLI